MTQEEFNKITAVLRGMVTTKIEGQEVSHTKVCEEHGEELKWSEQPSKKTGKHYLYHDNEGGERCFGRGYMPKLN